MKLAVDVYYFDNRAKAMEMDVDEAANCIKAMHGQSRIPDLLKYVDKKTKE
jgi:hypothetical protein